MGSLPREDGSAIPPVKLPTGEVVRLLFRHIFQSMSTDSVQDQDKWAEEFAAKDGGIKVLVSFGNLSAFQPKKPLPKPEPTVKHMTATPSKGTEQVSRKA